MGKTNQLGVLADVFTSDASNNVGIGGSPSGSYKLEVTGTAKVSSTLLVSGAATLSSTLTTTGIGINYTGTLAAKLHITAASSTSYAPMIALRDPDNPTYGFTFKLDTAVNGDMRIDRVNAGTDAAVMSFQRSTGNVGIGITTPSAKLDLGSNFGTAGTINKISLYNTGTTPTYGFGISAAQLDYVSVNDHVFYTGATLGERMRITSGGDILFGFAKYFQWSADTSAAATRSWGIRNNETADGDFAIKSSSTNNNTLNTTRLVITSAGNVGIGTSLPSGIVNGKGLVVYDTDYPRVILQNSTTGTGTGAYSGLFMVGNEVYFGNASTTGGVNFAVNSSSSAMKITSGGEVFIGASSFPSIPAFVGIQANTGNYNPIAIKDTGTTYGSGYRFIAFYNSSASIAGSIEHTGVTTTNYNTSSDIRLKKDLGVSTKSIIDEVIIHDFEWIEDEIIDKGVFAQELYKHKPLAVSVGKDDLTEDGKLAQPWGVDYSKLVPELIVYCQDLKKLVQEQQAIITSLQNRLDKAGL